MLKRGLISLALVFMLIVSFCGSAYADVVPQYELKLTTQLLIMDIPRVVYTAQLIPVPNISNQQIIVNFYNAKDNNPQVFELIGSAPIDNTGKATITEIMYPGSYVAVSKTVVGTQNITSNTVNYKVY